MSTAPDAAKARKIPAALRQQVTPPPPAAKPAAAANGASVQQGWMQLNKGQATQAVATFKSLLDKDPNDANALNGLGWAYLRSGKSDEAKEAFEKAIKADPNAANEFGAGCLHPEA